MCANTLTITVNVARLKKFICNYKPKWTAHGPKSTEATNRAIEQMRQGVDMLRDRRPVEFKPKRCKACGREL